MLPCLCPNLGLWAQGEVVSTSHSFLFSPSLRRRERNPDCALDIPCLSFRFSPRFTEALLQRKACTTGRRKVFQADLRTVAYWSWSTLWCKCIVSEGTERYRDLRVSTAICGREKDWTCTHSCFFLMHKESLNTFTFGEMLGVHLPVCYFFHIKMFWGCTEEAINTCRSGS